MTSTAEQHAFRRIVVTMGASESSSPVLETAVRLAAILGAELEGVFVEDINLIRLAELPFLREVRPWPFAEEALSSQRMQRELRTMARQAEHMLEQAAAELGVSCSFRVWRGRTEAASLTTAFEADVLSLGRISSRISRQSRIMPVPHRKAVQYTINSINVLFTDSVQAARALDAACHMAKNLGVQLNILLADNKPDKEQALKKKAGAILDANALHALFIILNDVDIPSLAHTVNASGDSVLIAEAGHPLLQNESLDQCLEALSCPLLLVR
ncbi:MAG: hypothetical protein ABFS24_13370 [Pseudomonadota bacterium]